MTKHNKTEERIAVVLMHTSTLLIAGLLVFILISVLWRALPAFSPEMILRTPQGGFYFGKSGGILNAIAGSIYLSLGATGLSLLISLPLALYINLYLSKSNKTGDVVRFFLDVMWGIPSVVYGVFGFAVMLFIGMKTSLLAGIITVSVFIIPIMVRAMDEVFKTVPKGLTETCLSLGMTRSETAYKIYVRQCFPGITTAVLLSFGRAIGDAASVLFTTGYTDHIPVSLNQPAATLPLAIFFQLSSPFAEVRERAYASAGVLIIIILIISIISRIFTGQFRKHTIKF